MDAFLNTDGSAFKLLSIKKVDEDRRVATVRIGPLRLGSIWITDCETDPCVSWPRTIRGYPIIEVDAELRIPIEDMLLQAVKAGGA